MKLNHVYKDNRVIGVKYTGVTLADPEDLEAPEWEGCEITVIPQAEGLEVSLLHDGEIKNKILLHPTELLGQSILERVLSRDVMRLQDKLEKLAS